MEAGKHPVFRARDPLTRNTKLSLLSGDVLGGVVRYKSVFNIYYSSQSMCLCGWSEHMNNGPLAVRDFPQTTAHRRNHSFASSADRERLGKF
jgi:hypothetical protein